MIYTIKFHGPWPSLGMDLDDLLVIQSELAPPYTFLACRPVLRPDYRAMYGALEAGVAELVTPNLSVAKFAAALGRLGKHPPSPPSGPRQRPAQWVKRPDYLRLVAPGGTR